MPSWRPVRLLKSWTVAGPWLPRDFTTICSCSLIPAGLLDVGRGGVAGGDRAAAFHDGDLALTVDRGERLAVGGRGSGVGFGNRVLEVALADDALREGKGKEDGAGNSAEGGSEVVWHPRLLSRPGFFQGSTLADNFAFYQSRLMVFVLDTSSLHAKERLPYCRDPSPRNGVFWAAARRRCGLRGVSGMGSVNKY